MEMRTHSLSLLVGLVGLGIVGCTAGTAAPLASDDDGDHRRFAPAPAASAPTLREEAAPAIVPSYHLMKNGEGESEPEPSAVVRWSRAQGGGAFDLAQAVTKTSTGVLVAGMIGPGATAGCGTRTGSGTAAFVASYTTDGNCSWATYFEGDEAVSASAVVLDGSGNAYVAGTFSGTVSIAGTPHASAGGYDAFAVKLGTDGTVLWGTGFGGTSDEYVYSATFAGGRFAIGGAFYDTMVLGSYQKTSAGDGDAFVAELTSAGAPAGLRGFGGDGWDSVDTMGATPSGDLVVGGSFASTVDFGSGLVTSAGQQDGFIAIYGAGSAPAAFRRVGGSGSDAVHGIAVDPSGNVHVAGYFQGTADLGGASAETGTAQYSAFVGTYAANLALTRVMKLDGDGRILPASIAIDDNGTVAVSGHFSGTTGIGTASGTNDAFVAVLDGDGTLRWTKRFGASGSTESYAIGFASNGDVVGVGSFDGSVTLPSGESTAAGETDCLVFALTP
jgi:hypothetical protein